MRNITISSVNLSLPRAYKKQTPKKRDVAEVFVFNPPPPKPEEIQINHVIVPADKGDEKQDAQGHMIQEQQDSAQEKLRKIAERARKRREAKAAAKEAEADE